MENNSNDIKSIEYDVIMNNDGVIMNNDNEIMNNDNEIMINSDRSGICV